MKGDPYEITIKYPTTCHETGEQLPKGSKALYYPTAPKGQRIVSLNSKSAADWASQQQADSFGLLDAGW